MSEQEYPTEEQASRYEMLSPMLNSFYDEVKDFSKKKQDGVLNKFKVQMINKVLKKLKEILVIDPSSEYLELLDEETLPQNSDTVMVLGQFQAAMKQFKNKYYGYNRSLDDHMWWTKEYLERNADVDEDDEEKE